MGDTSQSLVFNVSPQSDSPFVASNILKYMIGLGVIKMDKMDNVLDANVGYVPGGHAHFAIGSQVPVPNLRTNGVSFRDGRTILALPSDEIYPLICPNCSASFADESTTTAIYMAAISDWLESKDQDLMCQECRLSAPMENWKSGSGITLGNVVVTFWNWPNLLPQFIAGVEAIAENSAKYRSGKL